MPRQTQSAPVATSSLAASQSQLVTLAQNTARLLDWASQQLPWLWLVGSPAMLLLLLTGVVGAEKLRTTAAAASDELCERASQLAKSLGIRRPVLISTSASATTPLLLGIVRPMILLPASTLTGLSTSQLEMILMHELAHVRRHDNLINLLQRVVEALLFFHPGVWKLSAWVRLERELCCDRLVIRHTREPLAYAETLALLAVPQMSPRHALAAMASHQLVTRIRHMLNLEDHPMKVSRKVLVAALAVVVTLGLWIGAQAQTTKEEPKNTAAEKIADEKPAKKEEFVVKVYAMGSGTASDAAEILNSLAKQRDIDRVQVEVDARTSSLIVRYPRSLDKEIDDLVQEAGRKADPAVFRVFRLKSTDLGEAIRRLKADLADERGVRIEADHESHSLLIQHPERLEERINEAVQQIEPQVQSLKT
ncbi:MAG TPA: M56 family metallopeptidase, partial [Burkholderiaceae bacterium]|nr:M56 family metallopeptidase [Burkholderiaceae bacterium]